MNVANIFGLCFLAASFSPGYATECYTCYADVYTNQSAACAGPNIDSSLLRSCPENQTHCFFYSSVDETYWRISRKCTLPAPQPAVGCYSIDGYQSCITTCTTDGCNNQAINNPGLKKLSQRRCYQCRDFFMDFPLHSSRSCIGRNVNSSYLQPCPAGEDNCIFFKIQSPGYVGSLQRGSSKPWPSQSYTRNNAIVIAFSCNTDGCNKSPTVKQSIVGLFPSFILAHIHLGG